MIFGEYKVFGTTFTLHGGFQFWINKFLEGGAYPFMVPVLRGFVLPHATIIAFLVPSSVRRIGDRARARSWHPRPSGKLLRSPPHAHYALLFGLSRCWSAPLAILRREPEPLGICALLRRVSCRARGLRLIGFGLAGKSSDR